MSVISRTSPGSDPVHSFDMKRPWSSEQIASPALSVRWTCSSKLRLPRGGQAHSSGPRITNGLAGRSRKRPAKWFSLSWIRNAGSPKTDRDARVAFARSGRPRNLPELRQLATPLRSEIGRTSRTFWDHYFFSLGVCSTTISGSMQPHSSAMLRTEADLWLKLVWPRLLTLP